MDRFDESEVRRILRERGVAEHVVRSGASGLVAAWRGFVERVEIGYALGIEEYRNDLDIRTLIEIAGLAAAVEREDARLRKMLTRTDVETWSSDVSGAFWVKGFPVNAAGQLLTDLRGLSFL